MLSGCVSGWATGRRCHSLRSGRKYRITRERIRQIEDNGLKAVLASCHRVPLWLAVDEAKPAMLKGLFEGALHIGAAAADGSIVSLDGWHGLALTHGDGTAWLQRHARKQGADGSRPVLSLARSRRSPRTWSVVQAASDLFYLGMKFVRRTIDALGEPWTRPVSGPPPELDARLHDHASADHIGEKARAGAGIGGVAKYPIDDDPAGRVGSHQRWRVRVARSGSRRTP